MSLSDTILQEVSQKLTLILTHLTKPSKFQFDVTIGSSLSNAISFWIALALNDAFQQTFQNIKNKKKSLGFVWLYAFLVLTIGLLLMWILFAFILPLLHKGLYPKNDNNI